MGKLSLFITLIIVSAAYILTDYTPSLARSYLCQDGITNENGSRELFVLAVISIVVIVLFLIYTIKNWKKRTSPNKNIAN